MFRIYPGSATQKRDPTQLGQGVTELGRHLLSSGQMWAETDGQQSVQGSAPRDGTATEAHEFLLPGGSISRADSQGDEL